MLNQTQIARASGPRRGQRLMTGCAIGIALAAMARAPETKAQAFDGTGVFASGTGSITTGANQTNIAITSDTAVINWTPNNAGTGTITFLPNGATATFDRASQDYTVLNRIVPTDATRAIRFDGTVNSTITAPSTPPAQGGNVWFYSPGGIILGGDARFNVGSLVLTANDIDTTGGLFDTVTGAIRFRGQAASQSAIDIEPIIGAGAQINLANAGSYLAVVAPRVSMAGTALVNGSAAYVAAEQADVTINQGLFDISVLANGGSTVTGTDALIHSGSTTSPAPVNGADTQRIYMVAVPKNTAITMLVGGTLGSQATGAAISNGTIILSGGYDVVGGDVAAAPDNSTPVDLRLFDGEFLSGVTARTSGNLLASPFRALGIIGDPPNAGKLVFRGGLTLVGDSSASIGANLDEIVSVAGSLTVRSSGGSASAYASSQTEESGYGTALGTLSVTGDLLIDAAFTGLSDFSANGVGGNATGGTARFIVDGGQATVGGITTINADGIGGYGTAQSGNGSGGIAAFDMIDGTATLTSLVVSANGSSSNGNVPSAFGGDGRGGNASLNLQNGVATIQTVTLQANGLGGNTTLPASPATPNRAGAGTGGATRVNLNGTGTLDVSGGSILLTSNGFGGSGGDDFTADSASDGATGAGGTARFDLGTGTLRANAIGLEANGVGGAGGFNGDTGNAGNGGAGLGGSAAFANTLADFTLDTLSIGASGTGGIGGDATDEFGYGTIGFGSGGRGGNGSGGSASLAIDFDPVIDTLIINASGIGASGGTGRIGGNGGNGVGGLTMNAGEGVPPSGGAFLNLTAAELTVRDATILSEGRGGNGGDGVGGIDYIGVGGNGGSGTGGDAGIFVTGADSILNLSPDYEVDDTAISAAGYGGFGGFSGPSSNGAVIANAKGGNGGAGQGGNATISITNGASILGGPNVFVGAGGNGGYGANGGDDAIGGAGGDGGTGTGGTALLLMNRGILDQSDPDRPLDWSFQAGGNDDSDNIAGAGGSGGRSLNAGIAGGAGGIGAAGTGGTAAMRLTDSDFALGDISLIATGFGGTAGSSGSGGAGAPLGVDGSGGNGTGGLTQFLNTDDGSATAADFRSVSSIFANASGSGGMLADSQNGLDIAGRNELTDTASNPDGSLVVGDLGIYSLGNVANANSGFFLTSTADPLRVLNDAFIETGGQAAFNITGTGSFTVDNQLSVDAGGGISVNHSTPAIGSATIAAGIGSFTAGGNYTAQVGSIVTTTGALAIVAGGNLTSATTFSGANTDLTAANGAVLVLENIAADGIVNATGLSVGLTALGNLTIGQAQATAGALNMNVRNIVQFNGISTGNTIDIRSGDIVIGANARLGTAGTTTALDLTNSDSRRRTYVGGGATANAYSLSADEMTRLVSNNITIHAPSVAVQGQDSVGSARAADVIVGAFTLAVQSTNANGVPSGNLGTQGTLRIETPGKLRVNGAVALTGLGTGNRFVIDADDAIEVINGAGSIDMRGAGNALAGVLDLQSDDIIVATASAITDVGAATSTSAIDTRLAQNDGILSDDGALRAGGISVSVVGGFYVQNTGAVDPAATAIQFDARRGLTIGTGGLRISTASATTRIIINGRQVNATGAIVTGASLVPLVTINERTGATTGFDPLSTINGCFIASAGTCAAPIDVRDDVPIPPRDVVERPVNPDNDGLGNLFPTAIIELGDFESFGFEPLIDEPVTGAGNDDLWIEDCTEGGENCKKPGGQ